MKVFVTGAAGFVGLNVVRALLAEGHDVRAYVRPSTDLAYLQGFDVITRKGELDDLPAVVAAMKGAHAVIHCAGNTSCARSDYAVLHRTNVVGTQTVVDAAIVCGVKRLVYTSTTSTIGAHDDPAQRADEATPLAGFRSQSPYAVTKGMAEQIVLQAGARGLPAVILNPAEVIGPYDHNLQWGRMVLAVCADRVPFLPPGSASFCAAEEVGRAHVAALTQGTPGSRYILAGTDASFREFIDTACSVVGRPARIPQASYRLVRYRARAQEMLAPLTRRKPLVDAYRLKVFGGHYLFACDRAKRDLGYRPRPLRDMVAACHAWYRQHEFV